MIDRLLRIKYLYLLKSFGETYYEEAKHFAFNEALPSDLNTLRKTVLECHLCDLSKTRTNVVFGEGNTEAKVMFIGEGPGEQEDKTGRPFVGNAGQLLTKMIENVLEIKREEVYITNVVKCRPPYNRVPTLQEAESCKGYLLKQIKTVDPNIIVCLGKTAFQYVMEEETPISKARGVIFEFMGKKLVPTYHPSYLLRNPSKKSEVFSDLKLIRSLM